jgi:hypothetical protein
MEVVVNSKLSISANEQVILEMLRRGKEDMAFRYLDKVQPSKLHNSLLDYLSNLEKKGYIKVDRKSNKITLITSGRRSSEEWINEYRELFPPRKKGDRNTCIDKMDEFLHTNKKWDKDFIIGATKTYLEEQSSLKYTSEADNFIKKNGRSKLGIFCEDMSENSSIDNTRDRA